MWIPNGTSPCEMYKVSINERVASKGIAIVDYPIDKVFDFLENPLSMLLYDGEANEVKNLQDV